MPYWVIEGDSASNLVILKYVPKTSRVKTSPLTLIELLIALKDIWNANLGLIPRILGLMIE